MKHNLAEIFKQFNVSGVAQDSRLVKPGDAFFAIKGEKSDGNLHIADAFAKGAVVAFSDDEMLNQVQHDSSRVIHVPDARLAVAEGAAIIYPKIPDKLIAVTGTNGKTSVVFYCMQILQKLGIKSAAIGTLGIITDEITKSRLPSDLPENLTTADPITFRRILNELAINGVQVVAFEASSHGIDQKRLGNLKVDAAAFTSFSQDHLDYHGTMEDYLNAKLKLFSEHLKENAAAVVNLDNYWRNLIEEYFDQYGVKYVSIIPSHLSCHCERSEITIQSITKAITEQKVTFTRQGNSYNFETNIVGSFQASNLLIAAELVANIGIAFDKIIDTLPEIKASTGRLQRVTTFGDKFHVFVDYAHTPDALEKSLQELAAVKDKTSNLIVVFGCGGDRDRTKRPIMGKIASEIADYIIITDDNPRTEDPVQIRKEIINGLFLVKDKIMNEIPDRRVAIKAGIDALKENDILLIAGKGHEDYQIVGTTKMPFSDIEIAKEIIDRKK